MKARLPVALTKRLSGLIRTVGGVPAGNPSMNVQEIQLDGITYSIVRHVGSGGMAEVYKARRKSTGFSVEKQVALKRILPNLSRNEHFRRNFIDEANILGFLQHPNLVEVYNLHQSGNDLYLSMEFIEGTSLEELLEYQRQQKRPLSPSLLVAILTQVLEGLDAAHTARGGIEPGKGVVDLNIIHRDLKPSNILINVDGVVKIVDFGVAKAANRKFETVELTAKGTASYMSPEQIIGEPPVSRGSDLFSVGAVLFEMLTLKRLFDGPNVFAILRQVSDMDIDAHLDKVLPDTEAFKPILKKALARDPRLRYATAPEMLRELKNLQIQPAAHRLLGNMVQVVRPPDEDEVEEARTRVVHIARQEEGVLGNDMFRDQAVAAQGVIEPPARIASPVKDTHDEEENDLQTVMTVPDDKNAAATSKPSPSSPSNGSMPGGAVGQPSQPTWPAQSTVPPLSAPPARASQAPTVPITASRPQVNGVQAQRGIPNGFEPPAASLPPPPRPNPLPAPAQPVSAMSATPASTRGTQPTPGTAAFPTSSTYLPPGHSHPLANPDRDPYGPVAQPAPTIRLSAAAEPEASSWPAVLGGLLLGALLLGLLYLGSVLFDRKDTPPPPPQPAPAKP